VNGLGRLLAPSRWWRVLAALSLAAISFGVIAHTVPQNHELSPLDEYVYVDYLARVPTQFVVRQGETTGEVARDALACRGIAVLGPGEYRCGLNTAWADGYTEDGKTTADIYTPAYFAITWVAAQPFVWAGVDLVDAGRLVGGLWLGLGTVLMFLLMTRLRVPPLLAWALGVIVIVSPGIFWANAFVSTDAPSLAAGAGIGLLALLAYQRRASPVWLGLAVVLAIAIKFQNIIAVGLVAIVLTAIAIRDARARSAATNKRMLAAVARDRSLVIATVMVVVALATQVVWMVIRSSISLNSAPDLNVEVPLSKTGLLMESFNFLRQTPLGVEQGGETPVKTVVGMILVMLTIVGVVGMVFAGRRGSTESLVAGSVLLASTAAAPVLAIALNVALGETLQIPPRYGLSILPAFVLCAGWLFSLKRWGPAAMAVLAVVLLVASFLSR